MNSESHRAGSGAVASLLSREAYTVVLAGTVLALILTPRNASALTSLLAGAMGVMVLAALRWKRLHRPRRRLEWTLAMCAAAVGVLLARAMLSADPRISLVGALGQRAGALTWLMALLVLGLSLCVSESGDSTRVSRAIACAGATMSIFALLDRFGLTVSARYSPEVAGLFESSSSLGQVLVLALGAAAAWSSASGSRGQRSWALVCGALCMAGLAASGNGGAWLGLFTGAGVATVLYVRARAERLRPRRAGVLIAGLIVAFVLGTSLMLGASGPRIDRGLVALSNGRVAIWRSAVAQIGQAPLFGSGPEQFSAWVDWDIESGPSLSKTSTYDPHNLAFYWLLSTGIVGGAVALLAFANVASVGLESLARTRSLEAMSMFAGCGAWLVSVMFTWVSPLAVMLVAMLVGQLLRLPSGANGQREPLGVRATVIPATAAAVLVAVSLAGAVQEYQWARMIQGRASDPARLERLAVASGDPSLAAAAFAAVADAPGADPMAAKTRVSRVVPILTRASTWHVDAALDRFTWASLDARPGAVAEWSSAAAALSAGEMADPASGLWPTVGALQTSGLGLTTSAQAYLQDARAHALPPGAASVIVDLATR